MHVKPTGAVSRQDHINFYLIQRLRPNAQCRAILPKSITRTPAPQLKYTTLIKFASLLCAQIFPAALAVPSLRH